MSLAKCLGAARGAHALTPGLGTGSDDRQTEPTIDSAGLRPAASTRRMLRPSSQANNAALTFAQLTSGRFWPGPFFSPDGGRVLPSARS